MCLSGNLLSIGQQPLSHVERFPFVFTSEAVIVCSMTAQHQHCGSASVTPQINASVRSVALIMIL